MAGGESRTDLVRTVCQADRARDPTLAGAPCVLGGSPSQFAWRVRGDPRARADLGACTQGAAALARSGSSRGLTTPPPLRASPCGQGSPPDFRQDNSQTLSLYGHLEIRPVTLRAAKGLARRTEILRCAQHDSQELSMTARGSG